MKNKELVEQRKTRLHQMKVTLEKAFAVGVKVDKEKLIAECCYEWGIARRTCVEYLKCLKYIMDFHEYDGKISKSNQTHIQHP